MLIHHQIDNACQDACCWGVHCTTRYLDRIKVQLPGLGPLKNCLEASELSMIVNAISEKDWSCNSRSHTMYRTQTSFRKYMIHQHHDHSCSFRFLHFLLKNVFALSMDNYRHRQHHYTSKNASECCLQIPLGLNESLAHRYPNVLSHLTIEDPIKNRSTFWKLRTHLLVAADAFHFVSPQSSRRMFSGDN